MTATLPAKGIRAMETIDPPAERPDRAREAECVAHGQSGRLDQRTGAYRCRPIEALDDFNPVAGA